MRDIAEFYEFPPITVEELQAANKIAVNKNNNLIFLLFATSAVAGIVWAYVHFEQKRREVAEEVDVRL